ncbi:hypothetical protein, partial [Streptomyces fildesensis]|uniref:hypothetical protein n=1 Tax=Streptomyces fildesensis TaxID=375757 RepID=UPI001E5B73F6
LKAGVNHIVFLSISVGLPNIGPHFETWSTGVLGPVMLKVNGMSMDLTWKKWSYKVGLKGEKLKLHTAHGRSNGW